MKLIGIESQGLKGPRWRGLEGRATSLGWPKHRVGTCGVREGRLLSWGSGRTEGAESSLSGGWGGRWRASPAADGRASSRRFQGHGDGYPLCTAGAHLTAEPVGRLCSTLRKQDLESDARAWTSSLRIRTPVSLKLYFVLYFGVCLGFSEIFWSFVFTEVVLVVAFCFFFFWKTCQKFQTLQNRVGVPCPVADTAWPSPGVAPRVPHGARAAGVT